MSPARNTCSRCGATYARLPEDRQTTCPACAVSSPHAGSSQRGDQRPGAWLETGALVLLETSAPARKAPRGARRTTTRARSQLLSCTISETIASAPDWHETIALADTGQLVLVRQTRRPPQLTLPPPEAAPAIVQPLGTTPIDDLWLTAWPAPEGTLLTDLFNPALQPPETIALACAIRAVTEAVEAIHRAGFCVTFLDPEEVWFDDLARARLLLRRSLHRVDELVPPWPCAPGLAHPRHFNNRPARATREADHWAIAALAHHLACGRSPVASPLTQFLPAVPLRAWRHNLTPGVAPAIERHLQHVTDPGASVHDIAEQLTRIAQRRHDILRHPREAAITIAAESHTGIVKRQHNPINQDAIFAASDRDHTALLVIADGVSTAAYGSGDIASRFIQIEAEAAWNTLDIGQLTTRTQREAVLRGILQRANRRIVDTINERFAPFRDDPSRVMASTATIALIHRGRACLLSVGDSPAFLVRDDGIERLNRDHNVLTMQVTTGADLDETLTGYWPTALARCVGTFSFDVDQTLIAEPPQADYLELPLHLGDRLILCSDGVTDYLETPTQHAAEFLRDLVCREPVPALAALEALLAANRGGGGDNVSIAIAYVVAPDEPVIISASELDSAS